MKKIDQILNQKNISFFGYSYSEIPLDINKAGDKEFDLFFKEKSHKIELTDSAEICYYSDYRDMPPSNEIVFLDQDAVKSLCIGFPTRSEFVIVSLRYPRYYIYIILGTVRRLLNRSISIRGFASLNNGSFFNLWLLLKCERPIKGPLGINEDVGINGLLIFLKTNNINYVVPRHYESLPQLHRVGGDLDLLVEDKDEPAVTRFLLDNSGNIPVDIWTVSNKNYYGTSYMPPNVARNVIDNAVNGRASSKIPSPTHAFNCAIFHSLYHLGFRSGVPSSFSHSNKHVSSKSYSNLIQKHADNLGIKIECNMEKLDEYMGKIGWRPSHNALAKIAQVNDWVKLHHFDNNALDGYGGKLHFLCQSLYQKSKALLIKILSH